MNLNDFSTWLQYNKEWKIEGGLNTFRNHCIYIYIYTYIYIYIHYCYQTINRIQNKSFCSHNICVCVYCVYLLCIYKYKHVHVCI